MKKVTLKELVADKIIFAVLVALYYWMWARNDWKNFYPTIQTVVGGFTFWYFVSALSGCGNISRKLPTKWPRPISIDATASV